MPRLWRSSGIRPVPVLSLLVLLMAATPVWAVADNPVPIPRTTQPPAIDGRLSDWTVAGGAPLSLTVSPPGSRAGSAPFGAVSRLAWDEESLYVAVDVNDRELSASDDLSRDFHGSDSVRLYVSATSPADQRSDRFGEKDFVFIVTPTSLFQRPLKTVYGYGGYEQLGLDLTKLRVAARPTNSTGYALELAVPWRELGLVPKSGLQLGIQVMVIDAGGDTIRAWATLTPVSVERLESPRAMVAGVLSD